MLPALSALPIGCKTAVTRDEVSTASADGRVDFVDKEQVESTLDAMKAELVKQHEDDRDTFRWRFINAPISKAQRALLANKLFPGVQGDNSQAKPKKRRKQDDTSFSVQMRTAEMESHVPNQLLPTPLIITWSTMKEEDAATGIRTSFSDAQVFLVLLCAIVYGYGYELQVEWQGAAEA